MLIYLQVASGTCSLAPLEDSVGILVLPFNLTVEKQCCLCYVMLFFSVFLIHSGMVTLLYLLNISMP